MNQSMAQKAVQLTIKDLLAFVVIGSLFALLMRWYGSAPILPWAFFYCLVHVLFVIGRWLVLGVQEAAKKDPAAPRKVAIFESLHEASLLVSKLKECGISATAVGGFVSGFVAESPGYVDVLVPSAQYVKASELVDIWASK